MPFLRTHAKHALLGALAFALHCGFATGQTSEPIQQFPSKPITIVVTFPTGGGTDILARMLGVLQ